MKDATTEVCPRTVTNAPASQEALLRHVGRKMNGESSVFNVKSPLSCTFVLAVVATACGAEAPVDSTTEAPSSTTQQQPRAESTTAPATSKNAAVTLTSKRAPVAAPSTTAAIAEGSKSTAASAPVKSQTSPSATSPNQTAIGRGAVDPAVSDPSGRRVVLNDPDNWALNGNANATGSSYIGTPAGGSSSMKIKVQGESVFSAERLNGTINMISGLGNSIITPTSGATIGGGGGAFADRNTVEGDWATIGGGRTNYAKTHSFVGGGQNNRAETGWATIAGGSTNRASGMVSAVVGGYLNEATASDTFVGGGHNNKASAQLATVAGGWENQATAVDTSVGGGARNYAIGAGATVVGGSDNQAHGNYSTVLGGRNNYIHPAGYGSVAAGTGTSIAWKGCFVFSDQSGVQALANGDNQFVIRSHGGAYFYSGSGTGVALQPGSGTWANLSDRASKRDIRAIDPASVLAALSKVPISTWSYREEPGAGATWDRWLRTFKRRPDSPSSRVGSTIAGRTS